MLKIRMFEGSSQTRKRSRKARRENNGSVREFANNCSYGDVLDDDDDVYKQMRRDNKRKDVGHGYSYYNDYENDGFDFVGVGIDAGGTDGGWGDAGGGDGGGGGCGESIRRGRNVLKTKKRRRL